MRIATPLRLWSMVIVTAWAGMSLAQQPGPGPEPPGRPPMQPPDEQRERIREVMEKREQGQPLTPEETALIERVRAMKEQDERMQRRGTREENPFGDLGELNVVDRAIYSVAQILCEKGEYENAIKELAKVAAESPDERAKAGAHLAAGHICRYKVGDATKAIEEYRQVTGELADRALRAIVKCYEEMGQPDKAAQALEDRLAQASQPMDRVRLLNEIADVYRRSNNPDRAIETLRRVPQVITYEEAESLRRGGGRRGGRDFDPLDRVRQRIEELRAAGRKEEAEQAEKMLREMQERMRDRDRDERGEPPPRGID